MSDRVKFLLICIRFELVLIVGMLGSLLPPIDLTFPYLDKLVSSGLPRWLYSWGNFDGVHYIGIAMQGYHEFDQAFFPVYPMLIRALETYVHSYVLSGLLISYVSCAGAVFILYRLICAHWGERVAVWSTLFLLTSPTAFYFSAIYTESLFLFLLVGSIYAGYKRDYVLASMLGVIAGLTRIQGILLICAFLGILWMHEGTVQFLRRHFYMIISPAIGLGMYMVYLWRTVHDAFYFLTAQASFGAQRSAHLILLPQVYVRYVRIFMTADYSWAYLIAGFEFISMTVGLICGGVLLWRAYTSRDWFGGGIGGMSLMMLLMPALTGTFSSIPRYGLMALATYIVCAQIQSKNVRLSLLVLSILAQIAGIMAFMQGRFIS